MAEPPNSDEPGAPPPERRELEWADGWHEGDPFDPTEPHPMRRRVEKIMQGMDEIRAMYPTPEARTAKGIDEAAWQELERIERKLREAYPAFRDADDECIRAHLAERAAAEAQVAARERAMKALRDFFGPRLN